MYYTNILANISVFERFCHAHLRNHASDPCYQHVHYGIYHRQCRRSQRAALATPSARQCRRDVATRLGSRTQFPRTVLCMATVIFDMYTSHVCIRGSYQVSIYHQYTSKWLLLRNVTCTRRLLLEDPQALNPEPIVNPQSFTPNA